MTGGTFLAFPTGVAAYPKLVRHEEFEGQSGSRPQFTAGVVEKILAPEESPADLPVCLAGARACPPEDCGGMPGYESFLEALRDPAHEEHDAMLAWVGGSFDPEAFDLKSVNRLLQRMR